MSDDRPYVVERAGPKGRIRLKPEAIYWAQQHGMSLEEMGRYLLRAHAQQQEEAGPMLPPQSASVDEGPGANVEDRYSFSGLPSENIEDRRQDPIYGAGLLGTAQYNPGPPPNAQQWGPGGLASQLGFPSVGRSPPQQTQTFYGPGAPQWPQAFGRYEPSPFD